MQAQKVHGARSASKYECFLKCLIVNYRKNCDVCKRATLRSRLFVQLFRTSARLLDVSFIRQSGTWNFHFTSSGLLIQA